MDTKSSGSKKAKTTSKTNTKSTKQLKYSNLSVELTGKLDKETKKNNGIFFTPPDRVKKNLKFLKPYFESGDIKEVLEPSCGSGEYITCLKKMRKKLDSDKKFKITAIEYNKDIYNGIKDQLSSKSTKVINDDYLQFKPPIKYDLIIGNPPYYVIKKNEIDIGTYHYFSGRPNIFLLFIQKSLNYLNDNGILSFILPKNFLNCGYYRFLREHILKKFKILAIHECNEKYIETGQDTIMMIIQNSARKSKETDDIETKQKYRTLNLENNEEYFINRRCEWVFLTNRNRQKIKKLYENSTSLHELGFNVRVGRLVWNQNKEILTDDNTRTRLIYSSDIKDGKLITQEYKNPEKKNYIKQKGIQDMILLVNRGYGKGTYSFNYCLLDVEFEYLIENHLICIEYRGIDKNKNTKKLKRSELLKKYKAIIKSFEDTRTKQFVECYFGNNAINTSELNYYLPIYV